MAFQRLTVLSKDPEAKIFSSGENATLVTNPECPFSVLKLWILLPSYWIGGTYFCISPRSSVTFKAQVSFGDPDVLQDKGRR
jgi:hypothetical protein